MDSTTKRKPSVVILGGGFAGSLIAKELQEECSVTLVDDKDAFEFTPSILRTLIEPSYAERIRVHHSDYLTKATVIHERVKKVSATTVRTDSHTLSYDYLVIATGSKPFVPKELSSLPTATRSENLIGKHEHLKTAKSVLIIGGGLVGVELASEIITSYPEKKVTIIQGGPTLIPRNNPSTIKKVTAWLVKHHVEIIFDDRIVEKKKNVFLTKNARTLSPDIAFCCIGAQTNIEHLDPQLAKKLNQRKQIPVLATLQMEGFPKIFVAGDVTDIDEEKMGYVAEKHAWAIVKNIKAMQKKIPLVSYRPRKRPMIISLGQKHAIITYKGLSYQGWMPSLMKHYVERSYVRMMRSS